MFPLLSWVVFVIYFIRCQEISSVDYLTLSSEGVVIFLPITVWVAVLGSGILDGFSHHIMGR